MTGEVLREFLAEGDDGCAFEVTVQVAEFVDGIVEWCCFLARLAADGEDAWFWAVALTSEVYIGFTDEGMVVDTSANFWREREEVRLGKGHHCEAARYEVETTAIRSSRHYTFDTMWRLVAD